MAKKQRQVAAVDEPKEEAPQAVVEAPAVQPIRYAEDPLPWPARGDKAWLKSGSPELRVEEVHADGMVSASHSLSKDPDGDRLSHRYHPKMLTQTPTPVTSQEWR